MIFNIFSVKTGNVFEEVKQYWKITSSITKQHKLSNYWQAQVRPPRSTMYTIFLSIQLVSEVSPHTCSRTMCTINTYLSGNAIP